MRIPEWMEYQLSGTRHEQARALFEAAPDLTNADRDAINGEFPAYLFRVRKEREIRATCCGMCGIVPADSAVMRAPHRAEPKNLFYCAGGARYAMRTPKEPPPLEACPFCGTAAAVKELGRTGNRENLAAYRRIVVLKWHEGALWAVALYAEKNYSHEEMLTDPPELKVDSVYQFQPGFAARGTRYGKYQELRGDKLKPDFKFREPFGFSFQETLRYSVLGLEEIAESPFKWCGLEGYIGTNVRFLKLLAVASFYPRQVEMLTKAGLQNVVADFVNCKKKNAAVMDWEDRNPFHSFGLTKAELNGFLSGGKEIVVLLHYKRMKKAGVPMTFPELYELKNMAGPDWFERALLRMEKYRLSWARLRNYLDKEVEAERENESRKRAGASGKISALALWCDYIDAAEVLQYDLKNPVYLLPKNLTDHHDRAAKTANLCTENRKKVDLQLKTRARCKKLTKRYTYTDGRWLIRPPVTPEEILTEGKLLKHCVGGYADRHARGQVTILFLRDRLRPGVPLVTIEMKGNQIVQIHGYKNEREPCPENLDRISPRELYREFLDGWLAWLEGGSRRDKQGRPVMPQAVRQEERVTVIAVPVMV